MNHPSPSRDEVVSAVGLDIRAAWAEVALAVPHSRGCAPWSCPSRLRPQSPMTAPTATVREARHHLLGAAVLRVPGLPCVVHRRPPLARALRRTGSGRPVLLIRSCVGVRLARLHADVHRRLAHRGGFRDSSCGECSQARRVPGGTPGPASPASWRSRLQPSFATPISSSSRCERNTSTGFRQRLLSESGRFLLGPKPVGETDKCLKERA
jgi:hypothetical protein